MNIELECRTERNKTVLLRSRNTPHLTDSKYLELMRSYELDSVLPITSEMKKENENLNILEIGAGAGWQAKRLSETGYKVQAIDLKHSSYSKNRVWPIKDYDGKHIPFTDNYFDLVFSSNVLEHIPHLSDFQNEMQRILKPNGMAIHIVPSGSWRFWTNIAHYPYILKMSLKIIGKRIIPEGRDERYGALEDRVLARASNLSKVELVMKTIFPTRHGETGSALSELYTFSRIRWSTIFRRSGWKIKRVIPNRLFYTGYVILGSALPIRFRKCISYVLGSSCHVFVLTKKANI